MEASVVGECGRMVSQRVCCDLLAMLWWVGEDGGCVELGGDKLGACTTDRRVCTSRVRKEKPNMIVKALTCSELEDRSGESDEGCWLW